MVADLGWKDPEESQSNYEESQSNYEESQSKVRVTREEIMRTEAGHDPQ
jgi:hypothetical protein